MQRNVLQNGAHLDEIGAWFLFSPSGPGVLSFLFCLIRILPDLHVR